MTRGIFTNWLHAAFFAGLMVLTAIGYAVLPLHDPMPIHWDIAGLPDRFAPGWAALLIAPLVAIVLLGTMGVVERLQSAVQREAGLHIRDAAVTGVTGIALLLQTITLTIGLGGVVDIPRVIALAMALLLILLGNALPKSRRNYFAGIRLPSSLGDDSNWLATHRFGGRAYIVSGVLLALVALLVDQPVVVLLAVLAAGLVPTVAAMIYSLRHRA